VLREEEGVAARTLANLGVTTDEVRSRVTAIVGEGDEQPATGQIPFTPRAKKVLELSLRECQTLGHNFIGTEHILLGLVREREGVGARVLLELGADTGKVRDSVIELLGGRAVYPHATRTRAMTRFAPREQASPLSLFVVSWVLAAVTLGAGILIGWAIWG
jgi:ATP-dependent Clp protease ATP-binding subunit ClpA